MPGLAPTPACDRGWVDRQLRSPDMETNLQMIAALPNQVITQVLCRISTQHYNRDGCWLVTAQVRLHWLLELVDVARDQTISFSRLDTVQCCDQNSGQSGHV